MISMFYLLGYNLFSLVLWTYIHLQLLSSLPNSVDEPLELYHHISPVLIFVQTLALVEAIHPILGLTNTPVSSALMQVGSRLIVLYGYTLNGKGASHWSFVLTLWAWSFVELFRYSFYACTVAGKFVPEWLFQCRYSAFYILYPAGIIGEIGQILVSLPFLNKTNPMAARASHVLLALYVPLGPYMIFNMVSMRKRAMRKRLEESEKDNKGKKRVKSPVGIVWPITNKRNKERSTTTTNKEIWSASLAEVNQELAKKISKVLNWRFGYAKYAVKNVEECLKSKENALKIATNGLKAAHEKFVFMRDEKEMSMAEAMSKFKGTFETGFIEGEKPHDLSNFSYGIPYHNQVLIGDVAKTQLKTWSLNGTIENSAAESIAEVIDNPEWADLSDLYFVLLGATSAMGPLKNLLRCGANIIAIDIDRPHVWKSLIEEVKDSSGTLTFPLKKPEKDLTSDEEIYANAGSNLLEQTPEIANWLASVFPGKDLTIGNYTYLDGALHVQLAVACDAIMEKVSRERQKKGWKTNLAFLCTPTDVHCIPRKAQEAAERYYKEVPSWQIVTESVLHRLGVKNQLSKNVVPPVSTMSSSEPEIYYVDGIVVPQGPNYMLAKRIQHWRCVVAHQAGQVVSSNIAPSTATKSVVSNSQFAAAYEGFKLFQCMEVFQQETSSAVMLALLINDIRNKDSVSHIEAFKEKYKLENPFRLFELNSFHGGVWRCPYKVGSIGVTAATYYYLNASKIMLVTLVAILVGTTNYIIKGDPV